MAPSDELNMRITMQVHVMRLNNESFNLIGAEKKIVELRLLDEKRRNIKLGDTLEFVHREDAIKRISAKISAIFYYNSTLYFFG